MILSCPACGTRYQTHRAIAPPGTNVRCAKCLEVWFQPAGEDVEPDPDRIVTPPPPEPSMQEILRGYHAEDEDFEQGGFRPLAAVGWAGLILFLAGLAWGAIAYRAEIAAFWPESASFYRLAGMPVNTVGLDFANVSEDTEVEGGEPYLHISGEIVNVTDRLLPVPPIRVSLRDSEERELYGWTLEADADTLAGGAAQGFVTRLPNPPPETARADIRFVTVAEP